MDDQKLETLQAEDQLAISDPQAYLVSNPTPRDWNLSTQDIARSIKIEDPRQILGLTKEDIQGPRKLNAIETFAKGVWDSLTDNPIKESNETRMFYSSPNMTPIEAERLMNDVLYTDYKRREAETIKSVEELKYKRTYGFSNGVGSAIKYAFLGLTGGPVAGTAAVGAIAGAESAAQLETDLADRYIDKYGKDYTKAEMWKDTGLASAYGVFAGATEAALGIERIAAGALGRYSKLEALSRLARMQGKKYTSGALKALRRGGMGGLEEGFEELVQNPAEDITVALAGYAEDLTLDESFNKAFTGALYGAIIGGTMGWGLYRINRKSIIDKIQKWNTDKKAGLSEPQIVEMADQMLDDGKTKMLDEVATRVEIRNKYGEAYDLVKKRLMDQINATETVPWQDKAKTKEEYVQTLADSITFPAINAANALQIPLHDFLEIADVESWVIGNIAGFKPITNIADIDAIIAKQDAIIKDQREKKKLGVGNDQVMADAKQRKAIAQRVRREVAADQEIAKRRSTARKATQDYITAKELQPASVESLSNATTAKEGEDYVLFAGKKIPVQYEVVELSSIQPSHINGTPNPNYTNEQLQNRASRGTVQDVADLREKASVESFTPERLMKSPTSAEGAPVVNSAGEVIAGNGRAEIVRYAYENPETADKYKQSLTNLGFNIDGMSQPILIRRNSTMTPDEQIAAADISNISETSAFDEASQAHRDSKYLAEAKDPIDFASKLPMSERRGLMQNNGKWNKRRVQQRYESALLSWLCGNDTQLFERLVLDRGISQKVLDILTTNGNMIYDTATKYPNLKIREDIYHALVKMQTTTRDNFLEMTQQLSLDGHDVMPENMFVWNWLFADATSNRQFLNFYLTTMAKNQELVNAGEDLFGQQTSTLSKKDGLIQAIKKADQAKAELAASRGKKYEPLFNQDGTATDPILLSAIASYKNQFAPTEQLNQRVFVSMKGEIEGEYLDADKYLGLTDNPPADEIVVKMLRKFGVKGLRYYGRRDKHGIVTWQPTPVIERLYSQDLSNRLVVTHGISIDKLNQALDLGGLPAPSIAISRADRPLTDFGPIKLIGTKNTIDPSDPSNRVYDRDIWSQTFPTPNYKNATITQGRAFREKFRQEFVKADDENTLREVEYYATQSKSPYRAIDEFKGSEGAQLYYIENVLGKKITIPMKNDRLIRLENSMPFVKPDQQFIEDVLKIDKNIDNSDVLRKELEKPLRNLIARSPATEAEKRHATNYFFGENKEGLFNFSSHSVFNLAMAVREYAADPNKMSVDSYALFKELQKYDLMNDSTYTAWADKQIQELLGEPRVKVGNKLLPWTVENITKAMIRGPIVGSENISNGVGKVIASGARRFGSIEDIKQAGQALNTKEDSDIITDNVGARINAFADNIIKQGYSEFERESICDALIKVASMKNPTTEALQSALSSKLHDSTKFDKDLLEEGVQLIQEVKGLSRYYFEAKPQRTVGFNEFVGAVVPTSQIYDESAEKLAQQGLNVIRSDDLQEGIASLSLQNEDILFQKRKDLVRGTYDPELQTIILNKNWNELTLVHEFHHRYLELLWGYFKQAQDGSRIVSQDWLNDMERLFQMLEIDPDQGQLTTVQQEKFAYMVEAYLTGLGVENTDNLAFQGFLHWIPEQYRSIMDLGYLDENNIIQNPMLDEESVAWFNKWFASPFAPSLPSAPDAQRMINPTDENGEIIPANQKIMNNREKEWGQDSEEQLKADAQLYRAIGENQPSDMRAALDGEEEIMKAEAKNLPDDTKLPEPQKQTFREKWFKAREKNARERAAEMARKYLAENPDHARELAFADPETMTEYDAPVDQGMLIRAVMETVAKGSDEWYILDNNLAMVKSMSGSTLALSGDQSHQAYLDAKREVEAARELKAAVNYAGTSRGAMDKWNNDIRAFLASRTAAIIATEPDSEERKVAIKAMLEEAKTKFSGNTTNAMLNQLDLTGLRTKDSQVFIKWAEKQIKQAAHAKIDAAEQKELMKASIAAQLALKEIDSQELKDGKYIRAVQSAKDIRHWQFVKDKMKKAYIGRWGKFGIFMDNLFGSYAPSAMLMSVNTLFFANVPSTAINTVTTRLASRWINKNLVDPEVQKGEIKRIKQVFNATGMNLAQMDKPSSPSTLHGEKYTQSEQKHWYDFTFEILGRTDNEFRVPTFVDTLARIASQNANGDKARATALFKEYCRLNTTSEEAQIARKQALAVANMAVFTQDGIMASALNHIRSSLNTMSRGLIGLQPEGFGLGNILAPFLKTGANITEMGFSATLAPIRTALAGLQKLQGKEIPELKKIALRSDWINLAWMSVVLAVLAAINSDDEEWYIEPYEPGKRYDPNRPYDSVNFGGVYVKLDIFGPMAIPLRAALKMVNDWEKKKLDAVASGLFFGSMEALSDTPLVQQFTDSDLDYMTKQPGAYWSAFGYNQANKLVPAQVKTVSRAASRGADVELETPWMGKTINRKFHRNYGLDGERLTTNDLINILTNRVKIKVEK